MPPSTPLDRDNRPFAFGHTAQVVTFLRYLHDIPSLDAWELVLRTRNEHPELDTDLDALMRECEERLNQPRVAPGL